MSRRNLVWLAAVVAVGAMFYCLTPMVAKQDSVYQTYAPLVEVDALVRQRFVEEVGEDDLVDGAIRGLIHQLDPYSRYVSPEEMPSFERKLSGDYIGIGIEVGMRHGQIAVIAPVEQSPAAKAGVLAGDVILAVDGESTEGYSVLQVDEMLVGSPGTTVLLTVQHRAGDEIETLEIIRGPVSIHTVKGFRRTVHADWDYMVDPVHRIGYIRVSGFRDKTTVDFDHALDALHEQGVRGLVLDLRFNAGGLLPRAVEMVDRFVRSGVIVSTVTRKEVVSRYRAQREGTFDPVELAVLINGASASASEIVAGALQDYKRATIVGTRSFGKGSIQRVFMLRERNAAVRLTEAHYELPLGRTIHRTARNAASDEWGVIPDVIFPLTEPQRQEVQRCRNLVDGALDVAPSPTTQPPRPATRPATTGSRVPTGPEIWLDPQLEAALNVLIDRLEEPEKPVTPDAETVPER
jgi:carboxyl-terminal processing protease